MSFFAFQSLPKAFLNCQIFQSQSWYSRLEKRNQVEWSTPVWWMFIWNLEGNQCKLIVTEIIHENFEKINLFSSTAATFFTFWSQSIAGCQGSYFLMRFINAWIPLSLDWARERLYCRFLNFIDTYKSGKDEQRCSMGMR